MSCDRAEQGIEALAAGEPVDPWVRAHVDACASCQAQLAFARTLDDLLRARIVIEPPATFTDRVLARVRQEHWAVEKAVDFGFNLALAAGAAIVVLGLFGMAWSLDLIPALPELMAVLAAATEMVPTQQITIGPSAGAALVMLMVTLGVWWWTDQGSLT